MQSAQVYSAKMLAERHSPTRWDRQKSEVAGALRRFQMLACIRDAPLQMQALEPRVLPQVSSFRKQRHGPAAKKDAGEIGRYACSSERRRLRNVLGVRADPVKIGCREMFSTAS